VGNGPVEAAYKALEQLTGIDFELSSYQINAVTEGEDAMGAADLRIISGGRSYHGHSISTDVVEASVRACIDALEHAYADQHPVVDL